MHRGYDTINAVIIKIQRPSIATISNKFTRLNPSSRPAVWAEPAL